MQRAPSDAESSIFLGCRRQIRRISNTSCRKSFLKLRSDWAGCRFPPKLWANPACGLCMARQLGPRCACRPSHWPWPPAIAQGCSWLPSMCLAWAITPRAPSAVIACAPQRGANRKHAAPRRVVARRACCSGFLAFRSTWGQLSMLERMGASRIRCIGAPRGGRPSVGPRSSWVLLASRPAQ